MHVRCVLVCASAPLCNKTSVPSATACRVTIKSESCTRPPSLQKPPYTHPSIEALSPIHRRWDRASTAGLYSRGSENPFFENADESDKGKDKKECQATPPSHKDHGQHAVDYFPHDTIRTSSNCVAKIPSHFHRTAKKPTGPKTNQAYPALVNLSKLPTS